MQQYEGKFKIINGGTDLMVAANINKILHQNLIDISQVKDLSFIEAAKDQVIIGGATTIQQLIANKLITAKVPLLKEALTKMASTQIRNVATIAGNIANASPVADAACVLLGLGAELILLSAKGERRIALENFYKGFKIVDLASDEIIYKIEVPLQQGFCGFEKTSKRIAVDISAVNSVLNLQFEKDVIVKSRIAFGGVNIFPALAKKAAQFLIGKKLDEKVIQQAAEIAMQEFTPITDVRGSAEYRSLLIKNHIVKLLMPTQECK
jgi:xanthine dehydrogenase small subunit